MAKILFTAIVADMRNKLNGTVFSKNRYGAYARTKVTPVNPSTISQTKARSTLSTQSQGWRGITQPQRQGWIDAAASFPFSDIFGNSKILSGSALYVKLNTMLANYGPGTIADAPAPVAVPAFSLLGISASTVGGVVQITFDPSPVPPNFVLIVRTTGNVGPGISFVKNKYRFISSAEASQVSPMPLTANFAAKFGEPVLRQKIFAQAFLMSTTNGQVGIASSASTVVVGV